MRPRKEMPGTWRWRRRKRGPKAQRWSADVYLSEFLAQNLRTSAPQRGAAGGGGDHGARLSGRGNRYRVPEQGADGKRRSAECCRAVRAIGGAGQLQREAATADGKSRGEWGRPLPSAAGSVVRCSAKQTCCD